MTAQAVPLRVQELGGAVSPVWVAWKPEVLDGAAAVPDEPVPHRPSAGDAEDTVAEAVHPEVGDGPGATAPLSCPPLWTATARKTVARKHASAYDMAAL